MKRTSHPKVQLPSSRRILTYLGVLDLVWDVKAFKKPLYTATDLPSLNPETNIIFSPDGRYLLTGTAGAHAGVLVGTAEEEKAREAVGAGGGKVVVLRREGLGRVRTLSTLEM